MSMSQVVMGSALGCLLAQAMVLSGKSLAAWLQRAPTGRLRRSWTPGPKVVAMFVKYAAPVAVVAALITLGVWTVSDYLAAKSVSNTAVASALDPAVAVVPAAGSVSRGASDDGGLRAASESTAAVETSANADPYADPEFKVQHRGHRPGSGTLKDALLQREEAKASADLRRETQQHQQRSQYDCEEADRADHYLKAGLDVWGFAAWQQRYFPVDTFKGATLEQCRDIKAVVPASLDLQSTVAQQTR